MLKRFRMLVVDRDGGLVAAYLGDDAVKAEESFEQEAANQANEAVRMIVYPMAVKTRYPAGDLAQASVTRAARRVGLTTEIEAATSALKMATAKAESAAEDLEKARSSVASIDEHLQKAAAGKSAPLHSPESVKALRLNASRLAERATAKQEAVKAAQARLDKAVAALKEFDGAGSREGGESGDGSAIEESPAQDATDAPVAEDKNKSRKRK